MGDALIFSKREIAFLQDLIRRKVDFMVVGLGAAALQGAPVVTQDVDLWFRDLDDPAIRAALRAARGTFVPSVAMNPPIITGPGIALFDIVTHLHGLGPYDKEKEKSVQVPLGRFRLRVLSLEQIIRSKKAAGRPKDKLALPVLKDALATKAALARSTQGKSRRFRS